jgi:hypothetical protein
MLAEKPSWPHCLAIDAKHRFPVTSFLARALVNVVEEWLHVFSLFSRRSVEPSLYSLLSNEVDNKHNRLTYTGQRFTDLANDKFGI